MVGIRSIGWDDGDDWRKYAKVAALDEVKASTTIVPVVTLGEKIEMDVDTRAMANKRYGWTIDHRGWRLVFGLGYC